MNWSQILEDAIVGKVISTLLGEGYRITISDQDGGGLYVYAVEDNGETPKDGFKHWVKLTPGNGADVITDYTVSLEDALKPANDFAVQFQA